MAEWTAITDGGPLVRSRWVYNCYVLPEAANGAPLVVDVGLRSHAAALRPWVGESPVVLATHLHSDHVGGLPSLAASCDPAIVLPDLGRAYAEGEQPRTPGPREVAKIWPVLRSQRFQPSALLEPLRSPKVGYGLFPYACPAPHPSFVSDGDHLAGAEGWEVISAPGHTDDSTCFYNDSTRTLIAGDAILSVGGQAWFNPEYVDAERSAATEDRLRGLRVDVLLVGHGHPLVGRDLLASAHSFRDQLGWIPTCRRWLRGR